MDDAAATATQGVGPVIREMAVERLFGRYNYVIRPPVDADEGRLLLLHGENGTGKSTILRLVWNLLSPAYNKGHRGYLARTPFASFSLVLEGGYEVLVRKVADLVGPFDISVSRGGHEEFRARFVPDEHGKIVSAPESTYSAAMLESIETFGRLRNAKFRDSSYAELVQNENSKRIYIAFLERVAINPLLLADDRSLYSDDEELDVVRQRVEAFLDRDAPRLRGSGADAVARELRVTLTRLNDWLRSLTLRGQTAGSASANTIYRNVLQELAAEGPERHERPDGDLSESQAENLLKDLAALSPRFEEFELVPPFAAEEFLALLASMPPTRRRLAQGILVPYLDSLRVRYRALEEAERVLRGLLSLLNTFFTDKHARFSPRQGLGIYTNDDDSPVDPAALSSGERQLMMLLCTTILAIRETRLFIIDEPELSLGVKWQREILDALLHLTSGSTMQFVVATHSIEVIARHADSLVTLRTQ